MSHLSVTTCAVIQHFEEEEEEEEDFFVFNECVQYLSNVVMHPAFFFSQTLEMCSLCGY